MVRTAWFVRLIGLVVMCTIGAAPAHAQVPVTVGQEQDPQLPVRRADRENLRRQIYLMEGALARAVEYGAQLLNREIRTVSPEIVALAGSAKARGVYLEGYGVFFDVSVPVLLESQMWTFRMMFNQADPGLRDSLAGMKLALKETTDPFRRRALEYAIAQLEPRNPFAQGVGQSMAGPATPGGVGAALVNPEGAQPANTGAPPPSPQPGAWPVTPTAPRDNGAADSKPMSIDRMWLQNPDQAYTEMVRSALIDAMLDWSAPMTIAPEEWLTVGAREDAHRDVFAPSDLYDQVVTVVLRIKGSDLAAYRAGKIDREEAKRRVQTREF